MNSKIEKQHGLEEGNVAPDFCLHCRGGELHRLSDFRGTKVMLCFYRFLLCPRTACAIKKLIGTYKKLAWAAKLKVITVFLSDVESVRSGTADPDAPLPRLFRGDSDDDDGGGFSYPFLGLADPDGSTYSLYRIWKFGMAQSLRATLSHLHETVEITPSRLLRGRAGLRHRSYVSFHTEFLIDEGGRIVDVFRARNNRDSMDVERIRHFLMFGEKSASRSLSRTGSMRSIGSMGSMLATVQESFRVKKSKTARNRKCEEEECCL